MSKELIISNVTSFEREEICNSPDADYKRLTEDYKKGHVGSMLSVAVTGHRPNKLWGYNLSYPKYQQMESYFCDTIKEYLKEYSSVEMISGMALGVDTVFALAALSLKRDGYPVRLVAAVPFAGQESVWPEASQKMYRDILSDADEIATVCDGKYAAWKMQRRNEFMVDRCNKLIAIWDGTNGGTGNCVSYAASVGKETLIKRPNTF